MNPDKITLKSIERLLTYETNSRLIEKLDHDQLLNFAKCYIKLYLAQQETLQSIGPLEFPKLA